VLTNVTEIFKLFEIDASTQRTASV